MLEVGKYGPWAVTAGGSEGAGAEFAKQLTADDFNLALIARKPGPLQDTARACTLRNVAATAVTCSVRAHTAALHVEQLSTLHDLANDEKGIGS